MKNPSTKMMMIALLVLFGMIYGIDMATKGMNQVYGPLPQAEAAAQPVINSSPITEPQTETKAGEAQPVNAAVNWQNEPQGQDTLINRVADGTGKLLSKTAESGVELVVNVFKGLFG